MSVTIPSVHLNGTSARELQGEIRLAYDALKHARDKIAAMTVHPRDHYPKTDKDSYMKARAEHLNRLSMIDTIEAELMELWQGIADQASTEQT
jgi:hypothetical protein